ncbi:MAG TPA: hypothetical protein VHV74_18155 [Pseudonocardiaceae bacterium]|jgi:hypothetical protein|nr:hypothetical protein [Pseudonocardiaceae bacterium]
MSQPTNATARKTLGGKRELILGVFVVTCLYPGPEPTATSVPELSGPETGAVEL